MQTNASTSRPKGTSDVYKNEPLYNMYNETKNTVITFHDQTNNYKVVQEVNWDADVNTMINAFKTALLGMTFVESSIVRGMEEYIHEYYLLHPEERNGEEGEEYEDECDDDGDDYENLRSVRVPKNNDADDDDDDDDFEIVDFGEGSDFGEDEDDCHDDV